LWIYRGFESMSCDWRWVGSWTVVSKHI